MIITAQKTNGHAVLSLSGLFTGTQDEIKEIALALRPSGILFFEPQIHVETAKDFDTRKWSDRKKIIREICQHVSPNRLIFCQQLQPRAQETLVA
jgi:esterase/lipase